MSHTDIPSRVRTVRTVTALRSALSPHRTAGASIALVPTMGALHARHLSLIRHARRTCDVVVVSLFVNPSQFNEAADLERYPRDERADAELAAQAGADLLFAPSASEVYPEGLARGADRRPSARGSRRARCARSRAGRRRRACKPRPAPGLRRAGRPRHLLAARRARRSGPAGPGCAGGAGAPDRQRDAGARAC